MIHFVIRWVINALLLMLIPYIVPNVSVASFYTAMVTALVLALFNAIIKPILMILTLPINILTLGLFTLIINGLLFWFISSFVKGFDVLGFWPAFWAALVYSIFSILISWLVDKPQMKNE